MANLVKICGIKSLEFIDICAAAGADFIGFVNFAKSPRHVDISDLERLINHTPKTMKSVILTVNAPMSEIEQIAKFKPSYIQLHGNETPVDCQKIKNKTGLAIIKAIAIDNTDDVKKAYLYQNVVDILLFDTKPIKGAILPGGNGQAFNWALLAGEKFNCKTMVAGGLNVNNIALAMQQSNIYNVDVSSAVEQVRGVKDKNLIEQFIKKAKGLK